MHVCVGVFRCVQVDVCVFSQMGVKKEEGSRQGEGEGEIEEERRECVCEREGVLWFISRRGGWGWSGDRTHQSIVLDHHRDDGLQCVFDHVQHGEAVVAHDSISVLVLRDGTH